MSATMYRLAAAAGAATLAIAVSSGMAPTMAQAAGSAQPTGRVTVDGLNVRTNPSLDARVITSVDSGTLPLRCQVKGSSVNGNRTWYSVAPDVGKWVSGAYVRVRGTVPSCGAGVAIPARTTSEPVLNGKAAPSVTAASRTEYQPGTRVTVRCQVIDDEGEHWYLTPKQEWLYGDAVAIKGAEPEIC